MLTGLDAKNADEFHAAIAAARALLPCSPVFRTDVLAVALATSSAPIASLLDAAVSDIAEAKQVCYLDRHDGW